VSGYREHQCVRSALACRATSIVANLSTAPRFQPLETAQRVDSRSCERASLEVGYALACRATSIVANLSTAPRFQPLETAQRVDSRSCGRVFCQSEAARSRELERRARGYAIRARRRSPTQVRRRAARAGRSCGFVPTLPTVPTAAMLRRPAISAPRRPSRRRLR
jgi:hypothetical protein